MNDMNEKQRARYRKATITGDVRKSAGVAMTITRDELKAMFETYRDHPGDWEPSLVTALESIGLIIEKPIPVSHEACMAAGSQLPITVSARQVERAIQAAVRVMLDEGVIRLPE